MWLQLVVVHSDLSGLAARGSFVGINCYLFLILLLFFSTACKQRGRGLGILTPVLSLNALLDLCCVVVLVCLFDYELLGSWEHVPLVVSFMFIVEELMGRPSVGELCLKGGQQDAWFYLWECQGGQNFISFSFLHFCSYQQSGSGPQARMDSSISGTCLKTYRDSGKNITRSLL